MIFFLNTFSVILGNYDTAVCSNDQISFQVSLIDWFETETGCLYGCGKFGTNGKH